MIMLNLGLDIRNWGNSYNINNYSPDEEFKKATMHMWLLLVCSTSYDGKGVFAEVHSEILEAFNILYELGYLKKTNDSSYTFSAEGWKHLGSLQSTKYDMAHVFIAMWFSPDMESARETIRKAVDDCGYNPIIIDEKNMTGKLSLKLSLK
ncbi:MAG: hypothetical protein FWC13_13345 [Oscillospiraceae bacterium]|nr:hypothetical protein [Oscillospiraceae bacterium]